MGSQRAVALPPGQRRIRQMADGPIEDRVGIALDDNADSPTRAISSVPIGSPTLKRVWLGAGSVAGSARRLSSVLLGLALIPRRRRHLERDPCQRELRRSVISSRASHSDPDRHHRGADVPAR